MLPVYHYMRQQLERGASFRAGISESYIAGKAPADDPLGKVLAERGHSLL